MVQPYFLALEGQRNVSLEGKCAELFGQYVVLPFGACASVHGFCLTSYGLWGGGVRILKLLWTVYFDDFIVFEVRSWSVHISRCWDGPLLLAKKTIFLAAWKRCISSKIYLASNCYELIFPTQMNGGLKSVEASSRFLNRAVLAEARARRFVVLCFSLNLRYMEGGLSDICSLCKANSFFYVENWSGGGFVRSWRLVGLDVYLLLQPTLCIYCDVSFEPGGLGCVFVDADNNFRKYVSEFIDHCSVSPWNVSDSKHPIYEFELIAIALGSRIFSEQWRCRGKYYKLPVWKYFRADPGRICVWMRRRPSCFHLEWAW